MNLPANLQPGALVTESVRLVRPIREGGMGSVWVAEHLRLDAEVAVKFMAPELTSHPEMVERFTREARAAARMRSPHAVKIFDYGVHRESGLPYMLMELLEGEDLEERVSRAGRLGMKETVEVVTQLAKVIREAHTLGIVHRDIKPENVFLMSTGGDFFVKILDFGIAKQSDRSTVRVTNSGTTIGTPIYMSPEQILSAKDVDYRCDLWSLAVVAYFCLTGRVPFEGETFGAVCIAIDRGKMRLPSKLRSEVPEAVDAWFAKALARDIQQRFRTVGEMAEAFSAAMSQSSSFSFANMLSVSRLTPRLPERFRTRRMRTTEVVVPRGHGPRRVTTIASVGAMGLLCVGAMELGRAWFGGPAASYAPRAVLASPPLAYAEATALAAPPPRTTFSAASSAPLEATSEQAMRPVAHDEPTLLVPHAKTRVAEPNVVARSASLLGAPAVRAKGDGWSGAERHGASGALAATTRQVATFEATHDDAPAPLPALGTHAGADRAQAPTASDTEADAGAFVAPLPLPVDETPVL